MRSWAVAAVSALTSCVVYRDDYHTGYTDSTWTTTDPAPETPEGEVAVSWRVGSAGCEAAGVETIEVDLGGSVDAFACADEAATVSAPAGRHVLVLRGLDAGGEARYAGDAGEVRVHRGETTTAPTVVLSGLPSEIEVGWSFDNGLLCAPNGVREVEVDLFDLADTLVDSVTADCEDARTRIDDVEAGLYTLVVFGRDDDGAVAFSSETPIDAGRGDELEVSAVLVSEP